MSLHEYDFDNRFVCPDCFADQGIRDFIARSASSNECSFCGSVSEVPIAAPFKEVARHMSDCLRTEYDDAANCLPYCSGDGGYQGTTWDTWDLFVEQICLELPRDEDDNLLQALLDRIGYITWCQANPFSLNYGQHTRYSWEHFCTVVKHERRYFFADGKDGDGEVLSPAEVLETILAHAEHVGLCEDHKPGALRLVRARYQAPSEQWLTPAELGPPPLSKATRANRMSPAGIVMFYASDDVETALRETALPDNYGTYALGTFVNRRGVRILNLYNLPPTPSLFAEIPDSLAYDPRKALQFLQHISREISQPVTRDGREHIEYVPSQVVTEFIRSRGLGARRVDGIAYASAVHDGGVSYVLFADQSNLVAGEDADCINRDTWLELVDRTQRVVGTDDLAQWANFYDHEYEFIGRESDDSKC